MNECFMVILGLKAGLRACFLVYSIRLNQEKVLN